ncbi:MAG: ABC transporter permease, partial [Spirochaetes bacterium]
MKLSKIALRNIRRNTKRSILSATAITVATMAIVFMFALINGMILDMQWNITSYITGEIRLHNRAYDKNEMVNPV